MTMGWVKQNSTSKTSDASQDHGNMIHKVISLRMQRTSNIVFYPTSVNYVSWCFSNEQNISKHVSSSDIFIKSNLYNTNGLYFVRKILLPFNIYSKIIM